MSVLEKADRLRAIAVTYAEGEKERRERAQAAAMLGEVEQALTAVEQRAEAARAAARAGVPLNDVNGLLARGLSNLAARAEEGVLPSKQALQAARQKLLGTAKDIEVALVQAWRAWAGERVAELPVAKVAVIDAIRRGGVEDDLRALTKLAATVPTPGDVELFTGKLDRVRRVLDDVEPDDTLVALLGRLDASDGVALADLSDEELALLRANAGVAEQIVLRRRR